MSEQLSTKFKRGDIVRWNALGFSGERRDSWVIHGLACRESLLPIYKVRKGKARGEAVQTDLELMS